MQIAIEAEDQDITEINMTPLIDVMLVLLIIFMVTLPVMRDSANIELPQAVSRQNALQPGDIEISILADGTTLWEQVPVDQAQLTARMREAAAQTPVPPLQLYADRASRYEAVANLLAAAQKSGLANISFVTDPGEGTP